MRQCSRWRLLAAMVGLALACHGSDEAGPTVTVTGVGWVEENIDPSFWISPPPNDNTAFFDFWIHYEGDIAYDDLQYARVYLPDGGYWDLAPTVDFLDTTKKVIGGWRRWWWDPTPDMLPIGPMRAEVKLRNGANSSAVFNIPAPGSSTSGTYTLMYTEDATSPPLASAPMVRRATPGAMNTVTTATQTITITFSVDDTKVYDGWVWFYDLSKTYLGVSKVFMNPAIGVASPLLAGFGPPHGRYDEHAHPLRIRRVSRFRQDVRADCRGPGRAHGRRAVPIDHAPSLGLPIDLGTRAAHRAVMERTRPKPNTRRPERLRRASRTISRSSSRGGSPLDPVREHGLAGTRNTGVQAPDMNLRLRFHELRFARCYTGVTPPPPRRLKALSFRGLGHFAARTENPVSLVRFRVRALHLVRGRC